MKITIGWAGETSHKVAKLLQDWLKRVIQTLDPALVDSSEEGSEALFAEMQEEDEWRIFSILCLTQSNNRHPGMLFDAGAVASTLPFEKIYALLINLDEEDVSSPFNRFQLSMADKEGIREMVYALNDSLGKQALDESILMDAFEMFWPRFEEKFQKILEETPETDPEPEPTKSADSGKDQDKLMLEMLATVRALESRLKESAKATLPSEESEESEKAAQMPFQDSLEKLIKTLDEKDYSEDEIIDFLKNIGIPDSYSRYTVHQSLQPGKKLELHKKF